MTKSEIEIRLRNDAIFALNFAVDNNLSGLIESIRNNGFNMPYLASRKVVYDYLLGLLGRNKELAVKIVSETPYNKLATGYTAGFEDFFMSTQPAETVTPEMRFSLDSLLAGLGAGLSTYSAVSLAEMNLANGGTITDPVKLAELEAQKKAEEEAKKKRQMYWIIGGVIFVVILGVVVYYTTRKK